jgi:hypothetical protein
MIYISHSVVQPIDGLDEIKVNKPGVLYRDEEGTIVFDEFVFHVPVGIGILSSEFREFCEMHAEQKGLY